MTGDIEALNTELERLRHRQRLLESLMRLAQLPDVPEADALEDALEIISELTSSSAAFLAPLNQADGAFEAMACSSGPSVPGGRIALAECGGWVNCVESGEPVAGEEPSDEVTAGMPCAQRVERFVCVPIVAHGDVVAVGGVLNASAPYTEADQQQISMLFHGLWSIVQHQRAQRILLDFDVEDRLTGLANRDRFEQVCRIEIRRADRAGVPLGLVMLDLDDFAAYNAAEGRGRGDAALRRVAEALRESFQRAGEVIARFEADSFAMLLPATDHAAAGTAADRAREAVEFLSISHPSSDASDRITASVGLAVHEPRGGGTASSLVGEALAGIRAARDAGGNIVGTELPEL